MSEPDQSLTIAAYDFNRDVYCILGLPFDSVNMPQVIAQARQAIKQRISFVMATPNSNNIVECLQDADFRQSILVANLSIPDGMPVVWCAYLLGLPISRRVTGADFFDKMIAIRDHLSPIKVFFFGGVQGIAAQACLHLNQQAGYAACSGFHYPGFASVVEMSSDAAIASVNQSNADFLVLALSTKKGHAWIKHNRARLQTPLLTHLGAVINFVSGRIKRSPIWMQDFGMEWIWRIYQEPYLWRRYWHDAKVLWRLFLFKVFPYACWKLCCSRLYSHSAALEIEQTIDQQCIRLHLRGQATANTIYCLRAHFNRCDWTNGLVVEMDLTNVTVVDSAFLGLCLLARGVAEEQGGCLQLLKPRPLVKRIIHWHCAEFLLNN